MAGKPRVTVRLEPHIATLLQWYARGRKITTAELAAALIANGTLGALLDADLRAALIAEAGEPPLVPLAAMAWTGFATLRQAGQQVRAE